MSFSKYGVGILVLTIIVTSIIPALGVPGTTWPTSEPPASQSPSIQEPSEIPLSIPSGTSNAGKLEQSLKSLKLVKSQMNVIVCGKNIQMPVLIQQKYNDIYVPLNDIEVSKIFSRLGVKVTTDIEKRVICSSSLFNDKWKISIKIEIPATLQGECGVIRISPPPLIIQKDVYLCFKHIPLITGSILSYDKIEKKYVLDPAIQTMRLVPEKKRLVLKVEGTASFTVSTHILKSPRRYVIDIQNAHLGKNLLDVPRKEIFHKDVGRIIYGQNQVNPNRVRIVIPLHENLAIQRLQSDKGNSLLFFLISKSPCPLGMNFSLQKVLKVTQSIKGNDFFLQVHMSGPVEYEWHRFRPPDNRFLLDIHNAVLVTRKHEKHNPHPLIEEIRVGQFKSKPIPIVRVVFDLKDHYLCRLISTGRENSIGIIVNKELIALEDAVFNGNGVTTFPRPGKKVICIDPGHGGADSGAVNYTLNLKEEDVTLYIAKSLSEILVAQGYNVVLTRTTDRDVSYYGSSDLEELAARVKVASDMKADIFISLHCNASANRRVRGFSTYWYKECDRALAEAIHRKMADNLNIRDRKMHQERFYVLKRSSMPAVLIESAFISNLEDGRLLLSNQFKSKVSHAIADGIYLYFKNKK